MGHPPPTPPQLRSSFPTSHHQLPMSFVLDIIVERAVAADSPGGSDDEGGNGPTVAEKRPLSPLLFEGGADAHVAPPSPFLTPPPGPPAPSSPSPRLPVYLLSCAPRCRGGVELIPSTSDSCVYRMFHHENDGRRTIGGEGWKVSADGMEGASVNVDSGGGGPDLQIERER